MATSWRIVEKLSGGSLCGLKFLLPTSDETLFKSKSISSSTSNNNNNNNKDSASTSNCFQYLAKNLMVKLKSGFEKSGYMSIMSAPCRSFPITDCEAQPRSLFVKRLVPSLLLLMMNRRKSALVFPCGHLFTSSSSSSSEAAAREAAAARLRDEEIIARAREFVSRNGEEILARAREYVSRNGEAIIARAREEVSRYESSSDEKKKRDPDQCLLCSSGCIGCQKPWGFLKGKLVSSFAWWSSTSGCIFCFTGCVFCYETKTKTDEILINFLSGFESKWKEIQSRYGKGGLKTLPFIIANEAFERVASFGLSPTATNLILVWNAATNVLPVVGAVVADSYVGRYPMIGFGSIASLLGMILLWLTTIFPETTKPTTTYQFMLLYASFGFMTIGAGGIRASSLAFGADQVNIRDNLKKSSVLQSYFGWYNVAVTGSGIIAVTCIVYIQDHLGWTVGFGIPVVLMFLSAISFFLASPIYVKEKPNSNLFIGLVQVAVASYKNRHINISSQATDELYHRRKDSNLLMPTDKLRFLNKACIIRNPEQDLTPDGKASNPWSLCTIDQVEELKALIKVIPIWSTGIIFSININQGTLGALQAQTINRHLTKNFEIPAGSIGLFIVLSLTLWIALYDRVIIPVASKIKGKPYFLNTKLRMGIGLVLSVASMATWAIVESIRRDRAIKQGFYDDPTGVVDMSFVCYYHTTS
ncbi:hypothetical protein Q3G72_031641 [Acer saccharum]|nr:hypothetical protein Q3G72_031641 [Acer saccharum]